MAFVIKDGILKRYEPEQGETIITIPEGVEELGDSVFSYCHNLEKVIIPKGVRMISHRAFLECSNLKEVEIPEGVEKIGRSAFENCTSLQYLHLPSTLTAISDTAFMRSGLTEIQLPDSMERLTFSVFRNCEQLKKVVLPPNMKHILWCAFQGCTALEEVVLPDKLESVGNFAFEGTPWLENRKEDSVIMCGHIFYLYKGTAKKLIIPDNVDNVLYGAFRMPIELTFPEHMIHVGMIPQGSTLHFRTSKGTVHVHLVKEWADNAEEAEFLKFLQTEDAERREGIFQYLKKVQYKIALAVYMTKAHPEDEYYQSYLKRGIRRVMKTMIDTEDMENLEYVLTLGYVNKKNIDDFILYANEKGKLEMQIALMQYKDTVIGYQEPKFKL